MKQLVVDDTNFMNNMAEEELGQLHAIHVHMNAISEVQKKLLAQAELPSAEFCQDCGDEIPQARRDAVLGCQRCVFCQEIYERNYRGW